MTTRAYDKSAWPVVTTRNQRSDRNEVMSIQAPHSDSDLLDLLRIAGPLRVTEMAEAMEVTPTAVRQRLVRLIEPRFHPARGHSQRPRAAPPQLLADRKGPAADRVELHRLGHGPVARSPVDQRHDASAATCSAASPGRWPRATPTRFAARRRPSAWNRCRSLLAQRRIPVSVDESAGRTVLTAHACPYPNLAEKDRDVCSMEQMMFSELLGADVSLTQCRLDGQGECQFQVE